MKILVINLDRSPDRLQHMRTVFGEQGLAFERVPAIDAKTLSEAEIARWRQGTPNFYELGSGEVGCFLSHRKCWEMAAANPEPFTVICEDDIFLGRNAAAVLSDHRWIPAHAGIVKLEASRHKVLLGKDKAAEIDGRSLHLLLRDFTAAGCYLVSRQCAARLVAATETFCDPVDQYLFNGNLPHSHGEPVFQLVPAVAIQEFFLRNPSDMTLGSALRGERRAKRRTGFEKIRREIARPFQKLARNGMALGMRLFGKRRWMRVPFS